MVTYRIRILIFEFGNHTSLVVTDGQTNYEKFINGLLLMKGNVQWHFGNKVDNNEQSSQSP